MCHPASQPEYSKQARCCRWPRQLNRSQIGLHSFKAARPSPPPCRYAVPEPYEKLKAFTRGQAVTQASMQVRRGGAGHLGRT